MRRATRAPIGLSVLFLAGFLQGQAGLEPDTATARRFALILGANNGGSGRSTLRYAVADARAFRDVLQDLGGVLPEDGVLLEQPSRAAALREMSALKEKIEQLRPRLRRMEVLFYYSGHSDEESILLGNEKITYEEIRTAVNNWNADVRIAILDSCASGAFTVSKGVIKRSPFLLDAAYDMKGYAFLTSSSADEASQESRRLQGSFFTHNLLSAMRGAADLNRDGRITLTEAYQFAFEETLSQTEKTAGGPQHPNYNIQMSGTGDVVMTDITKSPVLLTLKGDLGGRFFIHNRANVLVVELGKPADREITIGLEEGRYRITAVSDPFVYEAEVDLKNGMPQDTGRSRFTRVDKIPTRARGDRAFIPSFAPRRSSRWQVEISGGIAGTEPEDLNRRAALDQGLIVARHDYYSYMRQNGAISFYQADMGPSLRPLQLSAVWGARIRRTLTGAFSLSLGLSGLTGTACSSSKNDFTVIETSGRQYIDQMNVEQFVLAVNAWIPTLSLHAGLNLFRNLRLEARLGTGPIFGACRYQKETNDAPVSDIGQLLEEPDLGALEEKGRGTGWSWDGGIAAHLFISPSWGLHLEAGYAFRRLREISGPGNGLTSGQPDSWDGPWAMKIFSDLKPWGRYEINYPSNYWPDDQASRRAGDFALDLSGFQIRFGLSLKL